MYNSRHLQRINPHLIIYQNLVIVQQQGDFLEKRGDVLVTCPPIFIYEIGVHDPHFPKIIDNAGHC